MNKIVVSLLLLLAAVPVFAQKTAVTAVDSTLIKQLFFAGLRDKLNEDYVRGVVNFSKASAIDPNNSAIYYELALMNYRLDKIPEAEIAIRRAIALDKNNLWYLKLVAELYKRTGNMNELVKVFDQLILLSPEETPFYFDRSNALLLSGKKDAAIAGYDLIEKKFGISAALTEAKARVTQDLSVPAGTRQVNSSEPIAVARAAIARKDYPAAARALESVSSTHQEDPLFLALYGDVLFETADLPAALTYYKRALKLTDQLYGVWEKVLNIHIILGQYKQMIEAGEAALSLYPNQAILYYYMAFAQHREAQNSAALLQIKTAMQLDGDNKTLQALISALQAEILIDEHKLDAADKAFSKAIELDPKNYQILNNYAYYLALRNADLGKAETLIATAAKALPQDASIADTYALVLFKSGKYELAKQWIEKAVANNEADNSVYLEHYGDILFLLGRTEQAMVFWQKSKDGGNDSSLLKRKIDEKKYLK